MLQRAAILSKLVSQEQLDEAIRAARQPAIGPPAPRVEVTDPQLARQMVDMGMVTTYQAEQLREGRTKFTLGDYLITDFIAQGGMGQVFKAEHRLMGREVAIKVLPQSRSNPSSIDSFTREIRTQAILDHDNLVRAFDAGHDGNVYYLVTEYVPGVDLRRLVKSRGPLSMYQAASIVRQAALGLASAHNKGLIHRDVKPGNILVTPEGRAKVSDLGLAGFLASDDDPRANKIVGTADYISPEQIKAPESATSASDIYSLGCTLYYAITGKVPYPGGTTRDKARRHLSLDETPWHPRRLNPGVSEEFVEVIADMMEKDPHARIQTAQDVANRLEPFTQESAPIPAAEARSPWMPPPLPASFANAEDLQITQDGTSGSMEGEGELREVDSGNLSQATQSQGSSSQETNRPPPLPPALPGLPPLEHKRNGWVWPVTLALMIAVPLSMLLGALVTVVVMLLLR
ncbi:MAG: serine/threonine protein kinase [Planctomycetales bacterium]|nr:serine/threonine protein kinase [Planctomycetales bacterium]